MVGKWHCGNAHVDETPHGRGFDTSLNYFAGAVDHFTSCNCVETMCSTPNNAFSNAKNETPGNACRSHVANPDGPAGTPPLTAANDPLVYAGAGATDLWCTDKPCYGLNATAYNDALFTAEAIRIIEAHPSTTPLYMYIAFQCNHAPLQVCPVNFALPSKLRFKLRFRLRGSILTVAS